MNNKFIQIMNKWIKNSEKREADSIKDNQYCRAIEEESYRAGLLDVLELYELIYRDKEEKNDN